MASAHFMTVDRTLRRLHMMQLFEAMEAKREGSFKASLVVNPRSGQPFPLAAERTDAAVRANL